jgi:RNA polymerase sigma-70 factor (sigma-E family)
VADEAFSSFVAIAGPDLLRFAYLTCGDADDAADLTQEALAAAYVRWNRIERLDSPAAYVRKIIVNKHISAWRRNRSRSTALDDDTAIITDITQEVDDRWTTAQLVRSLPVKQRAAVILRYFADYSDDEIAEALNCSASTVRSQIARALQRLRVTPVAGDAPVHREGMNS